MNVSVLRLSLVLSLVLSNAAIAQDAAKPTAIEFPDGKTQVVVPLTGLGGTFLVPATVNDQHEVLLMLDTGASPALSLDRKLGSAWGLPIVGLSEISAIGGGAPAECCPVQALSIGGVTRRRQMAAVTDMSKLNEAIGTPVAGMLGTGWLDAAPFTFDPIDATLTLHDPDAFEPPEGATRVEMRLLGSMPVVRATFEDGATGWLNLDTGSSAAVTLDPGFVWLNRDLIVRLPWRQQVGHGLGGIHRSRVARLPRVEMLGRVLEDIDVSYSFERGGTTNQLAAGHVGMELLDRFRLTFDFANHALWVEHRPDAVPAAWASEDFDVNAPDAIGFTPLMQAAGWGRVDQVERFIARGAEVNARLGSDGGATALFFAAGRGDVETLRILLEAGADPSIQTDKLRNTALIIAARDGHADAVKVLIDADSPLDVANITGSVALVQASHHGSVETVRHLLDAGANMNVESRAAGTALYAAAMRGHTELVRMLIDAGAEVDRAMRRNGAYPIHGAALSGSAPIVRILLDHGAAIDVTEDNGATPLIYAAGMGHIEVIDELLARGADPRRTDHERFDATAAAVNRGHLEVAAHLYFQTQQSKPATTQPIDTGD